jgi:hypothetical protein
MAKGGRRRGEGMQEKEGGERRREQCSRNAAAIHQRCKP